MLVQATVTKCDNGFLVYYERKDRPGKMADKSAVYTDPEKMLNALYHFLTADKENRVVIEFDTAKYAKR